MTTLLNGTASLVEQVDKRLLVVLRDGRKLIGTLRSFDQFANIVLEKCVERFYVGSQFGDVPLGLYIIRGENVVLLGDVDDEREQALLLERISPSEIKVAAAKEKTARAEREKKRRMAMAKRGLCGDAGLDDI